MTRDEATIAYIATKNLRRLYHAYRAMYRANGMMLHKISGQAAQDDSLSLLQKTYAAQVFTERKAYAQQMDLSFRVRLEQLDPRLAELEGWQA